MKVLPFFVILLASVAYFLASNWNEDFYELDTGSKVVTVIFQRILPALSSTKKTFFPIKDQRFLMDFVSRSMNAVEELWKPAFQGIELIDLHVKRDDYEIPIRIYRDPLITGKKLPVLLWIHGGGCILGNIPQDDNTCKKLALRNQFIVVSVDYRLAPEFIFPTAVYDVNAVLQWIKNHIRQYGGDASNVIISGESAGGYLTAAVTALHLTDAEAAQRSRLKIKAIVPIYPSVDASHGDKTMLSNITGILPIRHAEHMRNVYSGGRVKELAKNYLFAPLHTADMVLERFPPTIILLAKHDILAAEGILFADKLRSLGVKTELIVYKHSIHNFFGRWYFGEGDKALEDASVLLQKYLSSE